MKNNDKKTNKQTSKQKKNKKKNKPQNKQTYNRGINKWKSFSNRADSKGIRIGYSIHPLIGEVKVRGVFNKFPDLLYRHLKLS